MTLIFSHDKRYAFPFMMYHFTSKSVVERVYAHNRWQCWGGGKGELTGWPSLKNQEDSRGRELFLQRHQVSSRETERRALCIRQWTGWVKRVFLHMHGHSINCQVKLQTTMNKYSNGLNVVYRISANRRRGVYLFRGSVWCGDYSRAASIRGRRLFF